MIKPDSTQTEKHLVRKKMNALGIIILSGLFIMMIISVIYIYWKSCMTMLGTAIGLSLVGQVLGKSNLVKKANRMRTEKRSQPQIKNGDILLTMIGLLALGKSDFENVNEFHTDEEFYKNSLGIAYGIPSESSLRNRLDGIGTSMNQQILDGNVDMFLSWGYEPSALQNGCVSVDIDVSPFDNFCSHKVGVSRTYKNFDGYAPIFAYIGTEGYLCNAELREGKQHCQSGTPEFLA